MVQTMFKIQLMVGSSALHVVAYGARNKYPFSNKIWCWMKMMWNNTIQEIHLDYN